MNIYSSFIHRISSLAAKLFRIETDISSFTIRLFGRTLFAYKHTIIIQFSTSNRTPTSPIIPLHMEKITAHNILDYITVDTNITRRKNYFTQKHGPCEIFGLRTTNNDTTSCAWVMYRGGNVNEIRLKTVEAFIFAVFTAENYRRKGCCEYLLNNIFMYLHNEKGIDRVYLEVRNQNLPARAAYRKLGGIDILTHKRYRFLRLYYPSKHLTL